MLRSMNDKTRQEARRTDYANMESETDGFCIDDGDGDVRTLETITRHR